MRPNWIVVAGVWGALGVGLGAYGAHGLEQAVTDPERLAWYGTAVEYHLWHAPALALVQLVAERRGRGGLAGWLFLVGGLLFCGTLYAMTFGAPTWFGAITPLGGLALMGGWLALALAGRGAPSGPSGA